MAIQKHIVKAGENLDAVARQYNIKTGDLARWNAIIDNNSIKEGQELKLGYTSPLPLQVQVTANAKIDYLAKQFNISIDRIKQLNNLQSNEVPAGTVLTLFNPARNEWVEAKDGDTLEAIAKHYDITKEKLIELNPQYKLIQLEAGGYVRLPREGIYQYKEPEEPKVEAPKTKIPSLPKYAIPKKVTTEELVYPKYKDTKYFHAFSSVEPDIYTGAGKYLRDLPFVGEAVRADATANFLKEKEREMSSFRTKELEEIKKAQVKNDKQGVYTHAKILENTAKEFERITGIKTSDSQDMSKILKELSYPEKKVKETYYYPTSKRAKDTELNRTDVEINGQKIPVESLKSKGIEDAVDLQKYMGDTYNQYEKLKTDGINSNYIDNEGGPSQYIQNVIGRLTASGKLNETMSSVFPAFQQDVDGFFNDFMSIYKSSDINNRVAAQKNFLSKYGDMFITRQLFPKFLDQNALFLESEDLENKLKNLETQITTIPNYQKIIEVLSIDNVTTEDLEYAGISQSNFIKVGNLLDEYNNYKTKLSINSDKNLSISNTINDSLKTFQSTLSDFDKSNNLKSILIDGVNTNSSFGKNIRTIAQAKNNALGLRADTYDQAADINEYRNYLNWNEKFSKAGLDLYNAQVSARNWQQIHSIRAEELESKRTEGMLPWNWFNPAFSDVNHTPELILRPLIYSLGTMVNSKDKNISTVGLGTIWFLEALQTAGNVAVSGLKSGAITAWTAWNFGFDAINNELQKTLGIITPEEYETKSIILGTALNETLDTSFGLKDVNFNNPLAMLNIASQLYTGNIKTAVNGDKYKEVLINKSYNFSELFKNHPEQMSYYYRLQELNPNLDIDNIKPGDVVNLPEDEVGMFFSQPRALQGLIDPLSYLEQKLNNGTWLEIANQLAENLYDPLNYLNPFKMAGSITRYTGKAIMTPNTFMREVPIALTKNMLLDFKSNSIFKNKFKDFIVSAEKWNANIEHWANTKFPEIDISKINPKDSTLIKAERSNLIARENFINKFRKTDSLVNLNKAKDLFEFMFGKEGVLRMERDPHFRMPIYLDETAKGISREQFIHNKLAGDIDNLKRTETISFNDIKPESTIIVTTKENGNTVKYVGTVSSITPTKEVDVNINLFDKKKVQGEGTITLKQYGSDGKVETKTIKSEDVVIIDKPTQDTIDNIVTVWKDSNTDPNSFKMKLKVRSNQMIDNISKNIDWFNVGVPLEKFPPWVSTALNSFIDKAGFSSIERSFIQTEKLYQYFGALFDKDKDALSRAEWSTAKKDFVRLKYNEMLDENGNIVPIPTEKISKKDVIASKVKSLLTSPHTATDQDWEILIKYDIYPNDIKNAINKLFIQIARGDEVSKLILERNDILGDLVNILDVNTINEGAIRNATSFLIDREKIFKAAGIVNTAHKKRITEISEAYHKELAGQKFDEARQVIRENLLKDYSEADVNIAENIVKQYELYTSDMLQKSRAIKDVVTMELASSIDIRILDNGKLYLNNINEYVIPIDIFVYIKGEDKFKIEFKRGTPKAEIIEKLGRLNFEQKIRLLSGEKAANNSYLINILRDTYKKEINKGDSVLGTLFSRFRLTYPDIETKEALDSFISYIETYRGLLRTDSISFHQVMDINNKISPDKINPEIKLRKEILNKLVKREKGGEVKLFSYAGDDQLVDSIYNIQRLDSIKITNLAKNIIENKKRRLKDKDPKDMKILVFDTETSGLSLDKANLLSIGWKIVDGNGNQIKGTTAENFFRSFDDSFTEESFDAAINSTEPNELKDALSVNGIKKEDLVNGTNINDILDKLNMALNQADSIMGHNIENFDLEILKNESAGRRTLNLKNVAILDTMNLIEPSVSKGKMSQQELIRAYLNDPKYIEKHNAKDDIEDLLRLFKAVKNSKKLANLSTAYNIKEVEKNLIQVQQDLDVVSRSIEAGLGVGDTGHYAATRTKENVEEIRRQKSNELFDSLRQFFGMDQKTIEKTLFLKGKMLSDIFKKQDRYSSKTIPAKRFNWKNTHKTIKDIIFEQDAFIKEKRATFEKLKKDIETKNLELEESKKIKGSDKKAINKEIKNNNRKLKKKEEWLFKLQDTRVENKRVNPKNGIRFVDMNYGSKPEELEELKRLYNEGYRFVVMMPYSYRRFQNIKVPAIDALNKIGAVEELSMKGRPDKAYDFTVLDMDSNLRNEDIKILSMFEQMKDEEGNYKNVESLDFFTRTYLAVRPSKRKAFLKIAVSYLRDINNKKAMLPDGSRALFAYKSMIKKLMQNEKEFFKSSVDNILTEIKFLNNLEEASILLSQIRKSDGMSNMIPDKEIRYSILEEINYTLQQNEIRDHLDLTSAIAEGNKDVEDAVNLLSEVVKEDYDLEKLTKDYESFKRKVVEVDQVDSYIDEEKPVYKTKEEWLEEKKATNKSFKDDLEKGNITDEEIQELYNNYTDGDEFGIGNQFKELEGVLGTEDVLGKQDKETGDYTESLISSGDEFSFSDIINNSRDRTVNQPILHEAMMLNLKKEAYVDENGFNRSKFKTSLEKVYNKRLRTLDKNALISESGWLSDGKKSIMDFPDTAEPGTIIRTNKPVTTDNKVVLAPSIKNIDNVKPGDIVIVNKGTQDKVNKYEIDQELNRNRGKEDDYINTEKTISYGQSQLDLTASFLEGNYRIDNNIPIDKDIPENIKNELREKAKESLRKEIFNEKSFDTVVKKIFKIEDKAFPSDKAQYSHIPSKDQALNYVNKLIKESAGNIDNVKRLKAAREFIGSKILNKEDLNIHDMIKLYQDFDFIMPNALRAIDDTINYREIIEEVSTEFTSNKIDLTGGDEYIIYKVDENGELKSNKVKDSKGKETEVDETTIDPNKSLDELIDKDKTYQLIDGYYKYSNDNRFNVEASKPDIHTVDRSTWGDKLHTVTEIEPITNTIPVRKANGEVMELSGKDKVFFDKSVEADKQAGKAEKFVRPKLTNNPEHEFELVEVIDTEGNKSQKLKDEYIIIDVISKEREADLISRINKIKEVYPNSKTKELEKLESTLKKAQEWKEAITKKAKDSGIPEDSIYVIDSKAPEFLESDIGTINGIKDKFFERKKGIVFSNNSKFNSSFFLNKILTDKEKLIIQEINKTYTIIKETLRTRRASGTSMLFAKSDSAFTDVLGMEESLKKLYTAISKQEAKSNLEGKLIGLLYEGPIKDNKFKLPWKGKQIYVLADQDRYGVTKDFRDAVDALADDTSTTFIFPTSLNKVEMEMKRYVTEKGFKVEQRAIADRPVLSKTGPVKLNAPQVEAQQREQLQKSSYVLYMGNYHKDLNKGGEISTTLKNAIDAGTMVLPPSKIRQARLKAIKAFFGHPDVIKNAYKLPGLPLRLELKEGIRSDKETARKVIMAAIRRDLREQWFKWKTECLEQYRKMLSDTFKESGAFSDTKENLLAAEEIVNLKVADLESKFKSIEDNVLKWKGEQPLSDLILIKIKKFVINALIKDIADGNTELKLYEDYLRTGKIPSKKYGATKSLLKILSLSKKAVDIVQPAFVTFVLLLRPAWYFNNALEDIFKQFMIEKNIIRAAHSAYLTAKIHAKFGKLLASNTFKDIKKMKLVMVNDVKTKFKLGMIDEATMRSKLREIGNDTFSVADYLRTDASKEVNNLAELIDTKNSGITINKIFISRDEIEDMLSSGFMESFSKDIQNDASKALSDEIEKELMTGSTSSFGRAIDNSKQFVNNAKFFASETERMRRGMVLYRVLQNQTEKMAKDAIFDPTKARSIIKDFFFDYRDLNRAGMIMRRFFPFFSYTFFSVKLYLKYLLKYEGIRAYNAGIALLEIWEANTQDIPEEYKDRWVVSIGGKDLLIKVPLSVFEVIRLFKDPGKAIEDMADNPFKSVMGLSFGPLVGAAVEEISGKDYFTPNRKALRKLGWSEEEIEKQLKDYSDELKTESLSEKAWALGKSIVPQADLFNNLFLKADTAYDQTENPLKSKRFRELTKFFGINIMEWTDVDDLKSKLYSMPPSVRNFYLRNIKKEDPELYKEFNRQSRIGFYVNLRNEGKSEIEIQEALNRRDVQTTYYDLEATEDGAGDAWIEKNPKNKAVMEKLWSSSEKTKYKQYKEKERQVREDKRLITEIIEETIPSNLTAKNIAKYNALGAEYSEPINRSELIRDLTNKGLDLDQINTLITSKYKGVDPIRKDLFDQKKKELEQYRSLSKAEKDSLATNDKAYYASLSIVNKFLPTEDATEEEQQKAFERYREAFNKYLTPEQKERYLASMPEAQRILREANESYIKAWGELINSDGGGADYYEAFNKMPSWFKSFYFTAHPDAAVYYPLATEREKRFNALYEKESQGFDMSKERKALSNWFWSNTKEVQAWAKERPDKIKYLKLQEKFMDTVDPDKYYSSLLKSDPWFLAEYFKKNPEAKEYAYTLAKLEEYMADESDEEYSKLLEEFASSKAGKAYAERHKIMGNHDKLEYRLLWNNLIKNSKAGEYYQGFYNQPDWFKRYWFNGNPEAEKYYGFRAELSKKEGAAYDEYLWSDINKDAREAWFNHKPEDRDYYTNFKKPLSAFRNTNNMFGYYDFILNPKNSKYLVRWSNNDPKKIKAAQYSKQYYSLPSKTWEDQKARMQWIDNNKFLREWWDKDKTPEEIEISKKADTYRKMKYDIDSDGSGTDYYMRWREISAQRAKFLKDNPDLDSYLKKSYEDNNIEPTNIQKKLAIYNDIRTDEEKRTYLKANEDLAEYFLDGVPEGIRKIRKTQEKYFLITEDKYSDKDDYYAARNGFLRNHPELQAYWDTMSLPDSAFTDKETFNQWQKDLNKVLRYFDNVSSAGLSDSMRLSVMKINAYNADGTSPEAKWFGDRVYNAAMSKWIELMGSNKSIGMFFFRQLPSWIRARYFEKNPNSKMLKAYSLADWFSYKVTGYNKSNPGTAWALGQQQKYGATGLPFSVKKQVEKYLVSAGIWEDRSGWDSEKWRVWQLSRVARLNGLKRKDIETNPLIRKELYRVVEGSSIKPISPKIYNKKIRWEPVVDVSLTRL